MNGEINSQRLSSKGKTYFFDVKKAKNESLYLQITESGMPDKNGVRKRNTIIIFPEDFENFKSILKNIKLT